MRLKIKNSKNLEIMTREQLFHSLINDNLISCEAFIPYKESLKILLKDYFCTEEVYIITVGGYGSHFYIPRNNDPVEAISNQVYKDESLEMNEKEDLIEYELSTSVFCIDDI